MISHSFLETDPTRGHRVRCAQYCGPWQAKLQITKEQECHLFERNAIDSRTLRRYEILWASLRLTLLDSCFFVGVDKRRFCAGGWTTNFFDAHALFFVTTGNC